MKKLTKLMTGLAVFLLFLSAAAAQNGSVQNEAALSGSNYEIYDPLIPQSFAFDKKHGIFAGINNVDNEIVIVSHKSNSDGDGDGELRVSHKFLVDKVAGRHDVNHIYRPKSVAIYDGYVAFLASHNDGCYFAVLDLDGNLLKKLTFPGHASAFSYSPSAGELYISGENQTGFDVIVLDTSNGINRVDMENVTTLHYQKPRMSEEIARRDPWGIGMAAIAMSVVFLALLLLYLVFKEIGVQLLAKHDRIQMLREAEGKPRRESVASNVAASGGVYAAIAAAVHLYGEELHDMENTVLTINKVSRTYSPWSSKVHGVNTFFRFRRR